MWVIPYFRESVKRIIHLLVIFGLVPFFSLSQETDLKPFSLDLNYFYGNIAKHSKDIAPLATGHPTGFIASYNRKTYGFNEWERRYNYPDWGFSFLYQNGDNEFLGNAYGLYGHYNFYFLNRKLMVRLGQGVAYASNPFDILENKKNTAYGSHLLSATYAMANFNQRLYKNISLQAGISLIHYSNGNVRAPNNSTNTIAANLGLIYTPKDQIIPEFITDTKIPYSEPLHYNFVLRGGINQSDRLGLGRHPFIIGSAFIDKRINKKSTLHAGVDVFFARFLKEQIAFEAVAFPSFGVTGDEDWKRVGLFLGHELRLGNIAFVSQLGYYIYYPYNFEGRVYARVGLKRYFGNHIFGAVTVKAHGAKAEAVEFGIGYRL